MSTRVQCVLVGLVCFMAGALAFQAIPQLRAQPKPEDNAPKWSHGANLRVRKSGEPDFNDKTQKFGIEVFRDPSTGNWIYISETGSIAVVPGK